MLQAKESASAQLVTLILEDQQTQSTIAIELWREKWKSSNQIWSAAPSQ